MKNTVFTIGHSTHTIEKFVALLKANGVTAISDVRSSPYSRHNPQFNREALKATLAQSRIQYVFLGKELGARSDDPSCYSGLKVQYDRIAQTELFRSGIERVLNGACNYRIALMCAEKDPLECHRTILVARELDKMKVSIRHILASGEIETHKESMERLVRALKFQNTDLFMKETDIVNRAYETRGEQIAYTKQVVQPNNARKQRTGI